MNTLRGLKIPRDIAGSTLILVVLGLDPIYNYGKII